MNETELNARIDGALAKNRGDTITAQALYQLVLGGSHRQRAPATPTITRVINAYMNTHYTILHDRTANSPRGRWSRYVWIVGKKRQVEDCL